MSLDTAIIGSSLILAAVAAVVQFRAARYGIPELRPCNAAGGILATIYAIAYAVLIFVVHDNGGSWSQWVRPVALLAWPMVWIFPALISVRVMRRLHGVLNGFSA